MSQYYNPNRKRNVYDPSSSELLLTTKRLPKKTVTIAGTEAPLKSLKMDYEEK